MSQTVFPVQSYDLETTLHSGQAFRWNREGRRHMSVVNRHWISLERTDSGILAETVDDIEDWAWLRSYLQIDVDLEGVLESFPKDEPMQRACSAWPGLRLLRQDPWECLASFILSSTKQIVQIRQIVESLCGCFGEEVPVPVGSAAKYAFPTAERIAACSETELRGCKMGFRAPYLLGTARMIDSGLVDLRSVQDLDVASAREELLRLPGVGRKIADCVLLFAYGFQQAFPVDVWIMKALRQLYFPKRRPSLKRLHRFSETYFGPNAGYAQQYLFHYMRHLKPNQK
jgi:N-glycosylase/DNA lyase